VRTALLSSFNGLNPNGDWTLFVADLETGDQSTLVSWGIEFCGILPIPASIATQTPSQVLECSSNLTLQVTTPSTGPLTNQWYKDALAISGATNLTLPIVGAGPSAAGTYSFVVCNMSGCATSAPIVIGVADTQPPVISVCASNAVACPDGSGQYTLPDVRSEVLAADGCGSVTLSQSPSAGTVVASGTHTITITATDSSNRTSTCTATLVVLTNTSASSLSPLALCPGGTASFNTVPAGSGPFAFQWLKNGSAIPDATNSAFSIPSVLNSDAGAYCVVVSGACSSVTNCTSLTVFTNVTATTLLSVTNACPGSPAVFATLASGTGPRTFQWQRDGTNITGATNFVFSIPAVTSSDYGSYCVVVSGFCNSITNCASLSVSQPPSITAQPTSETGLLCSNVTFSVTAVTASIPPDITYRWFSNGVVIAGATNTTLTLTNLTADLNGSTYSVVVSNCANAVTSSVVTLTVIDPAPNIAGCVPTQTVGLTNSCTLTLPDLRNQLQVVDNCAGLTVVQTPAIGTVLAQGTHPLTLVATDSGGQSSTCLVTLVVVDAAPPVLSCPGNYTVQCAGPTTVVNYPVTAADLCTPGVTPVCVPPTGSALPLGATPVACFAADASGNTNTCSFTVTVAPYVTNFTVGEVIPDNSPLGLVSTKQVATEVGAISDLNVKIQLAGGFNGDLYAYLVHDSGFSILLNRVGRRAGDASGYGDSGFNVTLDDQATNDIHTYRLAVSGNESTPLGGALTGSWQPDGRLTDPALVLDTDARTAPLSSFNGVNPNGAWTLFLADLSPLDSATLVSWGLELCGNPPVAPTITQQPQSLSVDCSSNATFSVAATGTAPFTNQWYRNGVALSGIQSSTLTLNSASINDAGIYTVVVSGMGGSVTSAPVTLSVTDGPPVISCPASVVGEATSASGAIVTFTVPVSDACSPPIAALCVPPSGSLFPLGPTLVNCSATDVATNVVNCSFTLTVVDTTAPAACATPPVVFSAGDTNNNFAGPTAAAPSSNLVARLSGYDLQGFDADRIDAWFAHTFSGLPAFAVEVRLRIRLRAVGQLSDNDTLILGQAGPGGGLAALGWSRRLGTSTGDPGLTGATWSPGTTNEIVLNLGALPNVSGGPTDLRPLLLQDGYLDLMVQDDTAVDYAILEVVPCAANPELVLTTAPGACSAVGTFSSPVFTDAVDSSLTVACNPPSGTSFAIGTNRVTCTSTDDSGNVGYSYFNVVVNDVAPTLTITLQGANTVVCWPVTCFTYVLESTEIRIGNNGAPGAWVPIGLSPVLNGSQYCVTVPVQPGAQTFRLRRL
jgi:subtilisin-like proprotein convertase family protein